MNFIQKLLNRSTIKYILILFIFVTIISFWFNSYVKSSNDIIFLSDYQFIDSIIKDIENSEKNIYIAIFYFKTDRKNKATELKQSLIRAKDRGVEIYVVMEQSDKDEITNEVNYLTGKDLEKHGIIVRYDSPFRKLHAKLTIIDEKIVYIGSHNYTNAALTNNKETSVRILSTKIAKEAINYIKSIETFEIVK
ncbi:MAG: hypothetical protein K6348_00805 [Deferribacterales bacterium]